MKLDTPVKIYDEYTNILKVMYSTRFKSHRPRFLKTDPIGPRFLKTDPIGPPDPHPLSSQSSPSQSGSLSKFGRVRRGGRRSEFN